MKVLMQIRPDYELKPGGDSIQLLMTKNELEKLGVDIDISTELEPNLADYDLVHLFNLTRIQETYFQAKNATAQNVPIVLSTIYWPFDLLNACGEVGFKRVVGKFFSTDQYERIKAFAKYFVRKERSKASVYLMTHSFTKMQQETVEMATVCLPNAETEMTKLCTTLGSLKKRYIVVPNAVDQHRAHSAFCKKGSKYDKYQGYLISVGRIEPRKNQLNLLYALRKTKYKLLLIGKSAPGQQRYFDLVMKEVRANHNIEYLESVNNAELYDLFKHCRVSILPSWFETPGLVSLEAGAMGCSLVLTEGGTTRDYFGDMAFYCKADNPESIREAIDLAYIQQDNSALSKYILEKYTWENAALKTREGYELAMELIK